MYVKAGADEWSTLVADFEFAGGGSRLAGERGSYETQRRPYVQVCRRCCCVRFSLRTGIGCGWEGWMNQ